ncbi:MAG: LCP family protein [Acidimicrobiia bacterium]
MELKRTLLIVVLATLFCACNGDGGTTPIITQSSTSTTSTTAATTTTTTPLPVVSGDGVDSALASTIQALYGLSTGSTPPEAPESVISGFQGATAAILPDTAVGHVGQFETSYRVAVVEAGEDVTLAVADPTWRIVGGWWPSVGIEAVLGAFPKRVAVIGSDARPGEDPEISRADSIHFVNLAEDGSVAVVGVPRDSWVPIPGVGKSKINSSLSRGGPDLMMETFADVTGVDLDGYLLTGFAGFQDLIGVLGGLAIDVPTSLSDKAAKAYIDAGQQVLQAADALAFARVRKTLPDGDFGRSKNGGLALIAAASMLRAMGPGAIPGLIQGAAGAYSTDMTGEEVLLLAAAITRFDPEATANVVASGSAGTAGSASVVFLHDSAYQTFEDMADGKLGNE